MNNCEVKLPKLVFAQWVIKNRASATAESFKDFLTSRKLLKEDLEQLYDSYIANNPEQHWIWLFMLSLYYKEGDKTINLGVDLNNVGKSKKIFIDYMTKESEEGEQTSPSEVPSFDIEGAWKEYNQNRSLRNETRLIYGIATQADSLRRKRLKQDVVHRIFLRKDGSGRISVVTDMYKLLKSILNYKQELFNTLVKYINLLTGLKLNSALYTGRNMILNDVDFVKAMKEAYKLFHKEGIQSEVINAYTSNESLFLDALSAYFNLKYFDDLLHEELEGLFESVPALKGREVGYTFEGGKPIVKYTINPDSKGKVTGWNTAEFRDGLKESSNISKILIESVEVEDINGKKLGTNLTSANVIKAWNALIYLVRNLPDSNKLKGEILDALNNINNTPMESIVTVFRKLFYTKDGRINRDPKYISDMIDTIKYGVSKKDLENNYNLTEYDVNVLRTLFENFIDVNDNRINLIYAENRQIRSGDIALSSLLLHEIIPSLLIRVNPINYFETLYVNDEYVTRIHPRYDSNREVFNYRQILNNNFFLMSPLISDKIMEKYSPKFMNKNTISINIEGTKYTVGQDGFLFNTSNVQKNVFMKDASEHPVLVRNAGDERKGVIESLFIKGNLNSDVINNLLKYYDSGSYLDEDFKLAADVLKYIDTMLNLGLTTERGLNILLTWIKLKGNATSIFNNMFSAANKVAYGYIMKLDLGSKDINEWANDEKNTFGFHGLTLSEKKAYLTLYNGFDVIGTRQWINDWFEATAQYMGTNSKAVTKNLAGNNIPNTRPSSLAGLFRQKLSDLRKNGGAQMLFSTSDSPIIDFVVALDLLSKYNAKSKTVSKANVKELMYDSFVNNFLNSIANNGVIATQLTVYSDKTQIYNAIINLTKGFLVGQDNITLESLQDEDLHNLWYITVGNYFKQLYSNVISDLAKVLGTSSNVYEINNKLKTLTYDLLNQLRQTYNLTHKGDRINFVEDLHYRTTSNGKLAFNELLLYYNELFSNKKLFNNRVNQELRNFASDLIHYGVNIYSEGILSKFLNSNNGKRMINSFGVSFEKEWINDGKLIIAKSKDGNILYAGDNLDSNCVINPLIKRYFYLDNLISANLKYSLLGAETSHPNKASKNIKNLSKFLDPSKFTTEEILLYGNDLVSLKSGIEKGKNSAELQKIWDKLTYETISASEGTLYKRNVIIPATFQTRYSSSLTGNSKLLKIACIRDTKSTVFTINGDLSTHEDANDGAARVMPFEVILMNGALGDLAVSYDIVKSIGYNYDAKTGVMSELKFAAHTISNAMMRISNGSKYQLYNLFKQNCNEIWSLEIQDSDITNNKLNCIDTAIDFSLDITSHHIFHNGELWYNELGNYYKINNLLKIGNIYYTEEEDIDGNEFLVAQLFDINSNSVKIRQREDENDEQFIQRIESLQGYSTINSLYKLWEAMGGMDSGYIENNSFIYDESSNYAVVAFMNNYNIENGKENPYRLQSKEYYNLPLKDTFISYNVNTSAMKCGAMNVNPEEAWSGNLVLDHMMFDSTVFGVQQDSDHTADDAEMSEFTLVMSSVDAGGKMHWLAKSIFLDLGKVAETIISDDIQLLLDYVETHTNPNATEEQKKRIKSKLYHIIGSEFIRNGKIRGEGLGNSIINKVNKEFKIKSDHTKDLHKLPFSDPNIYTQVISSYITRVNRAIKRKHAGIGDVITPGFNVAQIFEINGTPYLYDDLYREATKAGFVATEGVSARQKMLSVVNLYLTSLQDKEPVFTTRDWVEPTDIVDVLDENGNVIATYDLDNIYTYYNFYTGKLIKGAGYRRNIVTPKNLRPQRVSFSYLVNGERRKGNLFQLKPVYEAFLNKNTPFGLQQELYNLVHKNKANIYDENGILLENVQILPETIINEAAELMASNIYKTALGQGDRSLNDILVNGIQLSPIRQINVEGTDLVFTSNSGNHAFVSFTKPVEDNYTLKAEYDELELVLDKYNNVHKYANINGQNVEVGRGILLSDMYIDGDGYIVDNGKIVDDNQYFIFDNKVYKSVDYVEIYDRGKYVDGKFNKYKVYYINKDALQEVFSIQGLFSEKGLYKKISDTIGTIFSGGNYSYIQLNSNLTDVQLIKNVFDFLKGSFTLNATNQALCKYTFDFLNNPKYNNEKTVWKNGYRNLLETHFNRLKQEKEILFEASRYYTAARIPAQSLQSYMQMKLVGYVNTNSNVAIVSHWQTFLQGSDYDIDKAYLMGFSFNDNGNFLTWSPLFNSTRKDAFLASMLLPTPKNKKLVLDEQIYHLDLTEDFSILDNTSDIAQRIKLLAQIISKIDSVESEEVHVKGMNDMYYNLIKRHEEYVIPENVREDTLKNSVSGKLQQIVLAIENIPLAYSSITMKNLLKLADNTPSGIESANITGMNPMTKYIMQYQNMIGKQVIGIAAVGEKVFMGLSYYYNELVREKDLELLDKNLKYLTFNQTFNRILGRWINGIDGVRQFYGTPVSVTKKSLTDINLSELIDEEYVLNGLYRVNEIRERLSLEYLGEELEQQVALEIKNSGKNNVQADLIISLLLSAATDNAKELILKRINAGPDMAGIYLNLIMLGFSINDICAFMNSPALEVLVNRTLVNMFDPYNNDFEALYHMTRAIAEAKGIISIYRVDNLNDFKDFALLHSDAFTLVNEYSLNYYHNLPGGHENKARFGQYIQAIVLALVKDDINKETIINYKNQFGSSLIQDEITRALVEDIFLVASSIKNAVILMLNYSHKSFDESLIEYMSDLNEFLKIHNIQRETTLLGTALMGLNKGLSTDLNDLIGRVTRIEKFWKDLQSKYKTIDDILESKPFYTKSEVEDIIKRAEEAGVTNFYSKNTINFDFTSYLLNLNNYREITAEYYNLIKDEWNVFDLMNRTPLYKAALEAFKVAWEIPMITITKNKITNIVQQEIRNQTGSYISPKQSRQLLIYAEKLLVNNWLLKANISFPVSEGQIFIDSRFLKVPSTSNKSLLIGDVSSKMSFKYWIEEILLPNLMINNSYTWIDENGLTLTVNVSKNNPFLKALVRGFDGDISSYRINIKINEIFLSEVSSRLFQDIINGLNLLSNIYIGDYSITDYIGLYSICTSMNRFGNDKLTGLFRELAKGNDDNLISKYLDYVGELDLSMNEFTGLQLRIFLKRIGFDIDDALLAMAPTYSEGAIKNIKTNVGRYIRISNTLTYKKRTPGSNEYNVTESILPNGLKSTEVLEASNNLMLYGTLNFPFRDRKSVLSGMFASNETIDILDGLILATELGLLTLKYNCS